MKRIFVLLMVTFIAQVASAGEKDNRVHGRILGGFPIHHAGYSCGYKSALRSCVWASYTLRGKDIGGKQHIDHSESKMFQDPIFAEKGLRSPGVTDLVQSGYLETPMFSGDDSAGKSEECQKEVHSLANMLAMDRKKHTLTLWADLSATVRAWAKQYGKVGVITGPIFSSTPERSRFGRIAIPTAFYKIVVRQEGGTVATVAFKIPQGARGNPNAFLATIDEIEAATGLNFLRDLDDAEQTKVESTRSGMWPVKSKTEASNGSSKSDGTPDGDDEGLSKEAAQHAASGEVWVDMRNSIYHTQASKSYGKGNGSFMKEANAKQLGFKKFR